ncbi:hypothetical protein BN77_3459 [Rhizobium mesoamericanum STM3625]|uniref:Uncharacterized protein n=1 Tax=Rhizobium mesoamericanum STM3625 TaxID=1211777 RepID=K0PIU4_9HYPH|nr:hypothetical protein BN77_3459 [Rhizobium mesoamericanum STM3625]
MLASNGTQHSEKITLPDQSGAPPGQAVGGALENGDIVTVAMENYRGKQARK